MQIIVAEEKHGTYYYDASTPEAWAWSSLKILTNRFNEGYWYYDPLNQPDQHEFSVKRRQERDELLAMTDEQIDAIPSDEVRVDVRKKIKRAKADYESDRSQSEQYERIKAVVEAQDDSLVTVGRGQFERQEPKAWRLLDERSDHEYERVTIEDVESPAEVEV
jgi:hypothetical protein